MILSSLVALRQETGKERETMEFTSSGPLPVLIRHRRALGATQKHAIFVEEKR
jgi:hypothetical protein